MKLLLDTNVFLWLVQQAPTPRNVLAQVEDAANELYVSLVTPWEMQVKIGVGKLALSRPVKSIIEQQLAYSSMSLLPITLDHIDALGRLPGHHRDPFDRLLVAQAMCEGMTLVSSDRAIGQYGVAVLWE